MPITIADSVIDQSLYVRFNNPGNTAVALTQGTGLQKGLYTASDSAIFFAALPAGIWIPRIFVGTAGSQSTADSMLYVLPPFTWSSGSEVLGSGYFIQRAFIGVVNSQTSFTLTGVTGSGSTVLKDALFVIRDNVAPNVSIRYARVVSYDGDDDSFTVTHLGGKLFTIGVGDIVEILPGQTSMDAIQSVTDHLATALELDGSVYRFTANALEQLVGKLLNDATIDGKSVAWHLARTVAAVLAKTSGNDGLSGTSQTEVIRNIADDANAFTVTTDVNRNRITLADGTAPTVVLP